MSTKAGLNYSPLSGRVYWGRVSADGVSVGAQRDVTSEFLQVMEMKFAINTYQKISVNGDNKYATLSVDLSKEVVINGVIYQEGEKPYYAEMGRQLDELLAAMARIAHLKWRDHLEGLDRPTDFAEREAALRAFGDAQSIAREAIAKSKP